jgi:hypothetical protein
MNQSSADVKSRQWTFIYLSKSNIIKTTSKLIGFLINSEIDYLIAANHSMKYIHNTKYLRIKYIVFDEDKLTIAIKNKRCD